MFLASHPELSIRTLQPLSEARMQKFTSQNVARFFFNGFKQDMKKIKFNSLTLFNKMELTIVQNKITQVIGRKRKRQLASLSSSELENQYG